MLSSFTRPQVDPNLYELTVAIDFHTIEVNGYQLFGHKNDSKYCLLCSKEEINSYMFGISWVWVNDDRIFIFGRTVPLNGDIRFCLILFLFTASYKYYTLTLTHTLKMAVVFTVALWNFVSEIQLFQIEIVPIVLCDGKKSSPRRFNLCSRFT